MALTQTEINEVMRQLQPIIAKALNESTSIAQAQANIQQGVTQYIGARYVPLFADPIEWDSTRAYEPLTIVLYQGNSFTTRQYTPAGIDINNDAFWAETGNYNAQIEQYRQEVLRFDARITTAQDTADAAKVSAATATTSATKAQDTADAAKDAVSVLQKHTTLSDYVEPEYVGDFVAYNGKFFGEVENVPYIGQGFCLGPNNALTFALRNDDDTSAKVATASVDDNTYNIGSATHANWGHANCLAYNPVTGHYYVYTGSELNKVVVTDANFSTIKSLTPPEPTYGNIAYDKQSGKVWYVTYNGTIYELVGEQNFTNTGVSFPQLFDQAKHIGQGMACYNGIAVFPCSSNESYKPTGFIVGDITTGEILKRVSMPAVNQVVGYYGEIEDCDFTDTGVLYFNTIKNHATDKASTYSYVSYAFTCNLFTGTLSQTPMQLAKEFFLEKTYSGFYSDGSQSHPYKDVAEWCLAMQTMPTPAKITRIGFASNDPVVFDGIVFIDVPQIYNVWFNPRNNVTLNGCLSVRCGAMLNIINRCIISECKDAPFNYLVRCTNSNLRSGTIALTTKSANSKITSAMLLQNAVQVNMSNLLLNGEATTPKTEYPSGFGYTIGAPLAGKYVAQ